MAIHPYFRSLMVLGLGYIWYSLAVKNAGVIVGAVYSAAVDGGVGRLPAAALPVGGSKVHVGSNEGLIWHHTPWLGAHAAKGPVRLLRPRARVLQVRTSHVLNLTPGTGGGEGGGGGERKAVARRWSSAVAREVAASPRSPRSSPASLACRKRR
uniref:Uncharacterized protein n=1 Tax=Oryza rufipogon TaxID=4529 RepID=A0A0E0MXN0_ORYRU